MLDYKIIGKRIKGKREQRHLSQAQLAEYADLSSAYVSRVERAKKQISLEALARVAEALETTVNFLLYGMDPDSPPEDEFGQLISDCSEYERHIIFEVIVSIKTTLRESSSLLKK